jgi:hypothetical protein
MPHRSWAHDARAEIGAVWLVRLVLGDLLVLTRGGDLPGEIQGPGTSRTVADQKRLNYHAGPAPAKTITPPRRHPGHGHHPPSEETTPDSRKGHPQGARVPLRDRQRIS